MALVPSKSSSRPNIPATGSKPQLAHQRMEEQASNPDMALSDTTRSGAGPCAKLFPFEPCCCLPPSCTSCIPANMSKIQDVTHMALVFGIVAGFMLIITAGVEVWSTITSWLPGGTPEDTCFTTQRLWCTEQVFSFLLIPSLFYWYGLIRQYDEDIIKKRKQLEDLQEENTQLYSDTIKEMEGMLENQADTNAGLAEKSFDAKKRDFLRFVKAAKKKYESYFAGSKAERKELTEEFRSFVKNFLVVFEEASVDPINHPMKLVGDMQSKVDEFDTLEQIAQWVIDTLTVTKVNYISNQMQSDKQMIANVKAEEWRTIAAQAVRVTQAAREAGDERQLQLLEEGGDVFGRRLSLNEDSQMQDTSWLGCTWYRCSNKKAEVQGESVGGFPFVVYIGCASIILFSREHTYLLGSLCASTAALLIALFKTTVSAYPRVQIIGFMIVVWSLIMVLIKFESIDEVMRLEAEVKDLKARAKALEEKQQRMNTFWVEVQNLADLWLHRTVPRLEVIKEAHNHLEYAKPAEILTLMRNTNQALQQLENSVGPRKLWLKNGGISDDDKKRFGETIHGLANNTDLPAVIQGLNQANVMIANSSRRASIDRAIEDQRAIKAIHEDSAPA